MNEATLPQRVPSLMIQVANFQVGVKEKLPGSSKLPAVNTQPTAFKIYYTSRRQFFQVLFFKTHT